MWKVLWTSWVLIVWLIVGLYLGITDFAQVRDLFFHEINRIQIHLPALRLNFISVGFVLIYELWVIGWKKSSLKNFYERNPTAILDFKFFILRVCNLSNVLMVLMFWAFFISGNILAKTYGLHNWTNHFKTTWWWLPLIFLVSECLDYFAHRLGHTVPTLWKMHQVHHSASKLSVLTDFRSHPGDQFANYLIRVFPLALLGVELPVFVIYSTVRIFISSLQHSNLPQTWGIVGKYFLISPRAHQLHHSNKPQYHHGNYGFFLNWFDHLFGTMVKDTGEDLEYGLNHKVEHTGLLVTLVFPYLGFLRILLRDLLTPVSAIYSTLKKYLVFR